MLIPDRPRSRLWAAVRAVSVAVIAGNCIGALTVGFTSFVVGPTDLIDTIAASHWLARDLLPQMPVEADDDLRSFLAHYAALSVIALMVVTASGGARARTRPIYARRPFAWSLAAVTVPVIVSRLNPLPAAAGTLEGWLLASNDNLAGAAAVWTAVVLLAGFALLRSTEPRTTYRFR